jgi:hypothetical protein
MLVPYPSGMPPQQRAVQACWTTGRQLFSGDIPGKTAFRQTMSETPEEQTAAIITGKGGIRSNKAISS